MRKLGFFGSVITLFFMIGWVMNIVKFAKADFDVPLKTEVVRGVGIVLAPVGSVIGWLNIGEEKD